MNPQQTAACPLDVPDAITFGTLGLSSRLPAGDSRDLPAPTIDVRLHQIGSGIAQTKLSRASARPLVRLLYHDSQLPMRTLSIFPMSQPSSTCKLRHIASKKYPVMLARPAGKASLVELEVPNGLPPVINVATLKCMVGARPQDVVFRKSLDSTQWEICDDDHPVSLQDRTQMFKIREWAILS